MLLVVLILLLGPAETLAGKYPQHSQEYLALYPETVGPLPKPPPQSIGELCQLIEAGHDQNAELFAALGEALHQDGDAGLAYRAFHRAQELSEDPEFRRRMQAKKDECPLVPDAVIETERRRARQWVEALQAYERERIARGQDPRERDEFYARYGRAERDMADAIRKRRAVFLLRAAGVLVGAAIAVSLLVLATRRRRRAAA